MVSEEGEPAGLQALPTGVAGGVGPDAEARWQRAAHVLGSESGPEAMDLVGGRRVSGT